MPVKVIGIGNILMGDDGIGIRVLEKVQDKFRSFGIISIIGETDFNYVLSSISNGDFIIILDSVLSGQNPGELRIIPIEEFICEPYNRTQHSLSLLNLLNIYFEDITGYIIGIEVEEIDYNWKLSNTLEYNLEIICGNVFKETCELAGITSYALND